MHNNDSRELEQYIDGELKRLPHLKAPEALRANVLARIADKTAFAPRTSQLSVPARVLAFGGMAACASLVFWLLLTVTGRLAPAAGLKGLDVAIDVIRTLSQAAVLLVKNISTPIAIALLVMALLSYLTCIGLGTVAYRLAFSGRRDSQFS